MAGFAFALLLLCLAPQLASLAIAASLTPAPASLAPAPLPAPASLASPGKFIPVSVSAMEDDQLAATKRLLHFKQLLQRQGRGKEPAEETEIVQSDLSQVLTKGLSDKNDPVAVIERKKRKMWKSWKKFKKWKKKKRKKRRMRNRIIKIITRKLESRLNQAGVHLNDKKLKRLFDIQL